ncbi:MAG: DUF5668 domain-containing protein [bacterium]|nr:DUF5668 domain-containing protein [bacterium]
MAETRNNPNRTLWGVLILLLGIVFLLNQLDLGWTIRLGDFWPLFIILPGLFFLSLYVRRPDGSTREGLLIPGMILSLLGAYFMFSAMTDWQYGSESSFVYTLIVAVAFFSAYYLGKRRRGYLIPAWILLIVSAIILVNTALPQLNLWPAVLIIFGIWLLARPQKRAQPTPEDKNNVSKNIS